MVYLKDGKLGAAEYQEGGAGGGLAKGLFRLVGASGGKSLAKAITKLPPGLRDRFGRLGIVPSVKSAGQAGVPAARSAGTRGAEFMEHIADVLRAAK